MKSIANTILDLLSKSFNHTKNILIENIQAQMLYQYKKYSIVSLKFLFSSKSYLLYSLQSNKLLRLSNQTFRYVSIKKILGCYISLSLIFSQILLANEVIATPKNPSVTPRLIELAKKSLEDFVINPQVIPTDTIKSTEITPKTFVGIVPDISDITTTPSLDKAPNGVDIVNIVAPNQTGISDNHYIDFNVNTSGVILNNSLQSVTPTQLGGIITSNPNLIQTQAKLILNQVVSTNSSFLLGKLEVAGEKADVLIANPNGLTCKDCGFINIGNLTLSTALIQKQNLESFYQTNDLHATSHTLNQNLNERLSNNLYLRIQKGQINIDSLNASNLSTLTLLAKSLRINKKLFTQKLSIVLGSNDIALNDKAALLLWQPIKNLNNSQSNDFDKEHINASGSSNNFDTSKDKKLKQESNEVLALDVAYLGGVYANSIYLVATDENNLIKNSGIIASLPSQNQGDGGFVIHSNGKIEISTPTTNSQSLLDISNLDSKDLYANAQDKLFNLDFHSKQTYLESLDIATQDSLRTQKQTLPSLYASYLFIQAQSLSNSSVIQTSSNLNSKLKDSFYNEGIINSNNAFLLQSNYVRNEGAIKAKSAHIIADRISNHKALIQTKDDMVFDVSIMRNFNSLIESDGNIQSNALTIKNTPLSYKPKISLSIQTSLTIQLQAVF